ncbi:uncharacterized protein EURHEDRAFT_164484 [Aspergillus ruber CBS 135680]|uniref:Uncharacterized protein n=1 Tax=Aspergillus ruber (strain CBS 135680) TaxID=1388766 RepID=A0A017S904_ASPRC|nr:uncharacterized protein EURHEDRAFT_164484 [Aspergillus ruber CBS 135680]EYE93089.1 hypothetical protein EURHEDRAFT_164484 [Aspergillus ruber CBS 135680]
MTQSWVPFLTLLHSTFRAGPNKRFPIYAAAAFELWAVRRIASFRTRPSWDVSCILDQGHNFINAIKPMMCKLGPDHF